MRRDEKMPIAIYCDDIPSIVSPAYFVFEVKKSDLIIPVSEYFSVWILYVNSINHCILHSGIYIFMPQKLLYLLLLASAGIRVGELVLLNRDDINFNERSCIVFGKGAYCPL